MLRLIDAAGVDHPLSGYTNLRIKHVEDGNDIMTFLLDVNHSQYPMIQNEMQIQTEDNCWLVKKIDDDKIECHLDFDFLKANYYPTYRSETKALVDVLFTHLPEGWSIEDSLTKKIRRTIDLKFATDYDVIQQCMSTYNVRFVWKVRKKHLTVYEPDVIVPTGEYLTSELNLRKLSFKGSSTEFATRLYGYGEENMTVENAMIDDGNGNLVRYGKPYVENFTYSDKVVCAYWKDERYTVPENLYEAMVEKLETMAKPVLSYECDVNDLAKQDSRYSFLDFAMFKKLILVDTIRKTKVAYQILEYVEYPFEPENNTVTLSSVPGTIQSSMKKIQSTVTEVKKDVIDLDSKTNAYQIAEQRLTALMTQSFGVFKTEEVLEDGSTVHYMHDKPTLAESTNIWKMTGDAFAVSSDGGATWNAGMDTSGNAIMNILSVIGIDASWIKAENLSAISANLGGWTIRDNSLYTSYDNPDDGSQCVIHIQPPYTTEDATYRDFIRVSTYDGINNGERLDISDKELSFHYPDGDRLKWSNLKAGILTLLNTNTQVRCELTNEGLNFFDVSPYDGYYQACAYLKKINNLWYLWANGGVISGDQISGVNISASGNVYGASLQAGNGITTSISLGFPTGTIVLQFTAGILTNAYYA